MSDRCSGKFCMVVAGAALLQGLLIGILIGIDLCQSNVPPNDAEVLACVATGGVSHALLDSFYGYSDDEQRATMNGPVVLSTRLLELGTTNGPRQAVLIEHMPPVYRHLGFEDYCIDMFLLTPSGPTNVFHLALESFGSFTEVEIVEFFGPHLVVANIAGRGRFMDLTIYEWLPKSCTFTNVYHPEEMADVDLWLSDDRIQCSSEGIMYDLIWQSGRFRYLPMFAMPVPFDSGEGVCHVLDIWAETWDEKPINFTTTTPAEGVEERRSDPFLLGSNDWVVVQTPLGLLQNENGILELQGDPPLKLWVRGSVQFLRGAQLRLLPSGKGDAELEHRTTSVRARLHNIYRFTIE